MASYTYVVFEAGLNTWPVADAEQVARTRSTPFVSDAAFMHRLVPTSLIRPVSRTSQRCAAVALLQGWIWTAAPAAVPLGWAQLPPTTNWPTAAFSTVPLLSVSNASRRKFCALVPLHTYNWRAVPAVVLEPVRSRHISDAPTQAPEPSGPKPVTDSTWPSHVQVRPWDVSPPVVRLMRLPASSYVCVERVLTSAPAAVWVVVSYEVRVCGWSFLTVATSFSPKL